MQNTLNGFGVLSFQGLTGEQGYWLLLMDTVLHDPKSLIPSHMGFPEIRCTSLGFFPTRLLVLNDRNIGRLD